MMKKMLIWVLAIMLCLSLVPSFAAKSEDDAEFTVEDVVFTTDSDEPLRFNSYAFEAVKPDEVTGNLSYIKFVEVEAGSLRYAYGTSKNAQVKDSEKYYVESSSKLIEDVTYLPEDTDDEEEVTIAYTAYTDKSKSYTGEIRIIVSEADNDGDFNRIFYYVKPGKRITLEAKKIYDACRNKGFTPEFATFSIYGVSGEAGIYYNYKPSSSDKPIKSTTRYYIDPDDGDAIDKLSVVVSDRADDDIDVRYTVYDKKENSKNGYIKIRIITEEENQDIYYEVTSESVEFIPGDFDDVCRVETGSKLDYVVFNKAPSDGKLYYDYEEEEGEKSAITASKSKKYYFEDGDKMLYLVSYVPKAGYKDEVIIEYIGYNVRGISYEGKIVIDVDTPEEAEAPDVEYSVKNTSTLDFTSSKFNSACGDATDGEDLDYVKFESLPTSKQGALYCDDDDVVTSEKYNKAELKDMTFEPKDGYKGTVTLKYVGYSVDGTRFTGKVIIEVTGTTSSSSSSSSSKKDDDDEDDKTVKTISCKGEVGKAVKFDEEDFYDVCDDYCGDELESIMFEIPSASNGTLYYDKDTKVTKNDEFFYEDDEEMLIADVTFVPKKSGTITVRYAAYTIFGDEFEGKISIKVAKSEEEEEEEEETEKDKEKDEDKNNGKAKGKFKLDKTYKNNQFKDVDENKWYGANQTQAIKLAFRYGLMVGKGMENFDPEGGMTVAEALTIAARIHNIYNENEVEFNNNAKPWYKDYVEYAIEEAIINNGDFINYERAITREEMAYIFTNVLPSEEMEEINDVTYIPDVNVLNRYYTNIMSLYKAGILRGNDDKGTFNPKAGVTRAEVSAIIVRIVDADERLKF